MVIADQGNGTIPKIWSRTMPAPDLGAGPFCGPAPAVFPAPQGFADPAGTLAGNPSLGVQPRHALSCGMLRAAEASLRCGPTGVRVAGGNAGELSARMSFWLLEAACREAQLWNEVPKLSSGILGGALPSPVVVSVEMPARALREGRLVSQARTALEQADLAPCLLEIVLPEYAVTDGCTEVLLGMSALRDLGVGLTLDRFGSLSASLRLLQRLPLTAVKLDPALSRTLENDRDTRATVGAAIGLAHALNTEVVATCVDTVAQRDILTDLGCDEAQGGLFGAPMAAEMFRTALSREALGVCA